MMLPQGWVETQLEAICHSINYGCTSTSDAKRGDIRYIRITDIQDNDVEWNNVPYLVTPPKDIEKYELNKGDLVFARTGATVGKSHLFDTLPYRSVFASYLIRVRCNEKFLCPTYAKWFFQSPQYWTQINDGAEGTGQPNFNGTKLAHLVVPLPPLAEQRRIVAKLDSLTTRIARARAELERIQVLKAHLRREALQICFADLGKHEIPLGELLHGIDAGKNMRCVERPPVAGEKGVVKVSAVTWGHFDTTQTKTLPNDYLPPAKARIMKGDLLISRANTLELVGAAVIVDLQPDNIFLSDKILRLITDDDKKSWILWYLRSLEGRCQIEGLATGNQLSMRNISQAALRQIKIPLPAASIRQQRLASLAATIKAKVRVETEAQRTLTLLTRLEASLLAKAFRGELVPQNPNDEPANVLLDRIRAERAAAPKPKRGRRQSTQDMPLPKKRQTGKHG
ncbi:restriction endonuclease subunit S [Gluconobacter oxydans]|uniref:restriction endonuclease subunit S n=1 Tax=Gluconobacter oxydans TaxID=442 RepID=UPI001CD87201|nr:restriction endonuclease subunit S [Gluconobacter oxydans]